MAKALSKAVYNKTKNTRLADRQDLCDSIWSKARGLMFTRQAAMVDRALIFLFEASAVRSIHMMFVFYPIDLLFLDENKRVVEVKAGLAPFRVYVPQRRAKYVIELAAGVVRKTRTRVGDHIKWL